MSIQVYESSTPPSAAKEILTGDERAGLFVDPRWGRALHRAYPRLRTRFLVLEEDGVVAGMIPLARISQFGFREVVSMPFGTHGGPVLRPNSSPAGCHALNARFVELLRGPRTYRFEMTVLDPPPVVAQSLEALLGPHRVVTRTYELDLRPGSEEVWNNYDQPLRRSVRQARKAGVQVRRESGESGLDAFYSLYSGQSRQWELTWHHSRRVLGVLKEALGDDLDIWIASQEGRDVAGQLALSHEGREITLWISGAAPESRTSFSFHYLLDAVVRDAASRGYSICHMGASMDNPGVEKFKSAFGSHARPLHRYYHQSPWRSWVQRLRWGRERRR